MLWVHYCKAYARRDCFANLLALGSLENYATTTRLSLSRGSDENISFFKIFFVQEILLTIPKLKIDNVPILILINQ